MDTLDRETVRGDEARSPITVEELVRFELKGKFYAVERYDAILWKIRSGYIVVLYGALVIVGTTQLNLGAILEQFWFLTAILGLAWGFSICGFLLDIGFLLSKLRVVDASNDLYKVALDLSLSKSTAEQQYRVLQDLLMNSGESLRKIPRNLFLHTFPWMLPLYFGTPITITVLYIAVI